MATFDMAGIINWFSETWKAQFPHGLFVSTESELAIHLENEHMTFPNEVIAGVPDGPGALYIGALYCVCNQTEIFNRKIRSIINTSHDVRAFRAYTAAARRLKENLGVTFARLMWKDSDEQVLAEADLEGCIKHIHAQRLRGSAVLVHCVMGRSRSAALTVA